jgi:hypothetical protein
VQHPSRGVCNDDRLREAIETEKLARLGHRGVLVFAEF